MHVTAMSNVVRPVADDTRPRPWTPRAGEGQVLILFALFLVVLIGFSAVAVDLGSWLKVRRDYQNAADAAALAGSPFLSGPTPDRPHARQAAWNSLASQLGVTIPGSPWDSDTPALDPVPDSTGTYSMWVSTPPIGAGLAPVGKYPGASIGSTDKTIFVWVQRVNPSYLARIFGINGSMIDAWATAGLFPSRYAVITLRQPGQAGGPQSDINLAGNNVSLTVKNGDVGGNYDMKLNSGSDLVLPGDSQLYLHNYINCGQQCWGNTQINDGGNPLVLKTAIQLPGPIPDPNYPLPTTVTLAPTTPTAALPYGYPGSIPGDTKSGAGSIKVGAGGDKPMNTSVTMVGPVATCDTTNAVKIGPGYYTNISVDGSYCLILDPAYKHNCISIGAGCTDTPSAVPSGQLPGVFYLNGGMSVKGGGMIVGDGVTLVVRPLSSPNDNGQVLGGGGTSSPGIYDLNATNKSGAWTRRGVSPYNWVTSGCSNGAPACWQYTNMYEADLSQTGIAFYVMRRNQIPGSGVAEDDNTSVVKIQASAALTWNGITCAPHDNVSLAGQPGHAGIGQLVCWTFTFNGGTAVTQTYAGPISAIPLLIEPKLGQP
jgi:Putative Flp pilus-assembly TadE/G-like